MVGAPDPLLSRAVLIGTGRYETLSPIGAVHNNLMSLADVLTDDRFWGLPPERCMIAEDPRTAADMLDPVMTATHDATDTLLLYYAGHGLVDSRRADLHLTLPGSDPQRIYTAVSYALVRDVLLDSRAARRIVILDCCYSGRALGQMTALASAVADEASAEGTFVLTASAENKTALARPGERYTAFTGELLATIRNGIADCGPVLDLDSIYRHLLESMKSKGLPLPQKRDRNTAGRLALVRNRAYQASAAGLAARSSPRDAEVPVTRPLTLSSGEIAESIMIAGHGGDSIEAYSARPLQPSPVGGVVVIHHMPGYDEHSKQIARTFTMHGYNAVMPNLYWREAPGASPDDAAAVARAAGGVPDERLVGDVGGAVAYLKGLPNSNGKIATIGYSAGGRQSFLAAVSLPFDAAVDCYGPFIVGTPPEGMPLKVSPIVDKTPDLSCPLLGLFGADDLYPSPEEVAELEKALQAARKTYEFHIYEGAGHAFFAVNRPAYRPEAAMDGWQKIFAFFGKYLAA